MQQEGDFAWTMLDQTVTDAGASVITSPAFSDSFEYEIEQGTIFAGNTLDGLGYKMLCWAGGTGMYYEADTIEELAEMLEIDPAVLTATVDRYNELCDKGIDEDFGKRPEFLHPVKEGPFIAARAQCHFFCTASGVRCNGKLQVVDKDWQPIPHLFAAGNTAGWRLGCGYQMTIPGMCNGYALFHGYVAGRYAADENFDWDQLEA